jgi:hypothetical protein
MCVLYGTGAVLSIDGSVVMRRSIPDALPTSLTALFCVTWIGSRPERMLLRVGLQYLYLHAGPRNSGGSSAARRPNVVYGKTQQCGAEPPDNNASLHAENGHTRCAPRRAFHDGRQKLGGAHTHVVALQSHADGRQLGQVRAGDVVVVVPAFTRSKQMRAASASCSTHS